MIQATIIPKKKDVHFSLPEDYIGKKIHAIFYVEDEIIDISAVISPKKPSDFFGIFNKEEADEFEKHTQQIRNEWSRII
ncbi:hypothetical protein FNW52_06790 [Flavobacterium sp. ZT3R18]|uniref:hypothetical protein n=1 Tax=Flavobacterium sp. ZT3R18 TaxID=2594429 RepID=UPI00117AF71D|nr:hypothetical protein [Flavobacterium sp. ZT3R18]TRX36939.1 hypothetical protein FNW52_06790 [Flavobacterium sp. ZT3R18]